MNFTAIFIRRPIMTTLVMTGIFLFGAISYTKLSVSDLPTVDFPTISVYASLPGASPETMAATVATPLEKSFSSDRRDRQHHVVELPEFDVRHDSVRARPGHRRGRPGRQRGDLRGADQSPVQHHPALLPQAESGRRADSVLRADVPRPPALDAGRVRRDDHRAAAVHGQRRRPGVGLRLAQVRGPRSRSIPSSSPPAAWASIRSRARSTART